MSKLVGKRLKMLRNILNFNQKDFANYLGVNPRSYERWEQNRILPDIHNLLLIADKLELSIDWLLGRTETFYLVNCDIEKYLKDKL
ncbi:helix-turn-helix domain-containing protein [Alkaliphilus sp. B6464]|uniref:helix-turn-helix domain-containing protein n=1 Tax=Alkaliphilus sp. B6464 TaxID=2731219 RepID=UPI001BAABAA9|nr:helix-turn-helix transcriptional regulator [Alkaliphilus sp. B6464]QUH21114.1 helix-turn-helix transcriptional regulator [Alkaliphilus sp. B6464]